jgi:hypothetical protein
MNKILMILGLAVGLSQATVIHWSGSNDVKSLADAKAGDGFYTGYVDLIEMNDGSDRSAWSETDPLLSKFVIMDLNADKLYITTSNAPGSIGSSALVTADFLIDLNTNDLGTSEGYQLRNIVVNNTIGSAALAEFKNTVELYPGAVYTFSSQGSFGNGQVGTVPEPTTLGLMGLGLLGLGLAARRKKTA